MVGESKVRALSVVFSVYFLALVSLTRGQAFDPSRTFTCTRGKDSVEYSNRLRFAMSMSQPTPVVLKVVYQSDTMMLCESFFSLVHRYAKSNSVNYATGTEVVLSAIVADTPLPIANIQDYQYVFYDGPSIVMLKDTDTTITLSEALKSVSSNCNLKFHTDDHIQRFGILYRLTRERFNLIAFNDSVRVEGGFLP